MPSWLFWVLLLTAVYSAWLLERLNHSADPNATHQQRDLPDSTLISF